MVGAVPKGAAETRPNAEHLHDNLLPEIFYRMQKSAITAEQLCSADREYGNAKN